MKIVEKIRRETDLVELVRSYGILLNKVGQNLQGLCPFHTETNPSFTGLSRGHGVITVLAAKKEEMQSIFWLRWNIFLITQPLRCWQRHMASKRKGESSFEKISKACIVEEILASSTDFFVNQLFNSDEALGYLIERGLDEDSIISFKLGFAPPEYALRDFLIERGVRNR